MDWKRPSLPPFLHCNIFRSSIRCEILQACLGPWSSPRFGWDFHSFIVFNILATVPVTRPLSWYRERAYVLSYALFDTDVFLKASVLGYWFYSCWLQHRRSRVPCRRRATTSTDRIPMDHACSWSLVPVDASSIFYFLQTENASAKRWADRGLGSFQRYVVPALQYRDVFRFLGVVRRFFLYRQLRPGDHRC